MQKKIWSHVELLIWTIIFIIYIWTFPSMQYQSENKYFSWTKVDTFRQKMPIPLFQVTEWWVLDLTNLFSKSELKSSFMTNLCKYPIVQTICSHSEMQVCQMIWLYLPFGIPTNLFSSSAVTKKVSLLLNSRLYLHPATLNKVSIKKLCVFTLLLFY